jgi:hypothetical protein
LVSGLDRLETGFRSRSGATGKGVTHCRMDERHVGGQGGGRGGAQRASGRMKVNLAPPVEDSAQIFPPWASTIPLAM